MSASPARLLRPRDRRQQILAAAARLFRDQGYHATAIDDIGAAVAITGPAIYRHFPSKQAILAALITHAFDAAEADQRAARAAATDPAARLRTAIAAAIRHAEADGGLTALAEREWATMPAAERAGLEDRLRALRAAWAELVAAARPDLSPQQAAIAARALLGLIGTVRGPAPRAAANLVQTMAEGALGLPA